MQQYKLLSTITQLNPLLFFRFSFPLNYTTRPRHYVSSGILFLICQIFCTEIFNTTFNKMFYPHHTTPPFIICALGIFQTKNFWSTFIYIPSIFITQLSFPLLQLIILLFPVSVLRSARNALISAISLCTVLSSIPKSAAVPDRLMVFLCSSHV